METLFYALSALVGLLLGVLLTRDWYRSRYTFDDQPVERSYPPKLTLIERQERTGTDDGPPSSGRGW